jgi:hypothetical protein
MDIFSKIKSRFASKGAERPDFSRLESQLSKVLIPVVPRPAFVDQLRANIELQRPRVALLPRKSSRKLQTEHVLLGAAGAASLSFAVFAGLRMFVAVLIAISLLFQLGQQTKDRRQKASQEA